MWKFESGVKDEKTLLIRHSNEYINSSMITGKMQCHTKLRRDCRKLLKKSRNSIKKRCEADYKRADNKAAASDFRCAICQRFRSSTCN